MKDFLGQEIEVGSKIVYPGRCFSSLYMNKGFVTEICNNKLKVTRIGCYKWEKPFNNVVITETNRVVVVPSLTVG